MPDRNTRATGPGPTLNRFKKMLAMIAAFAPDATSANSLEVWKYSPRMEIMKTSPDLKSSTAQKKIVVQTVDQTIEVGFGEIWYCEHSSDFRLFVICLDTTKEVCCTLVMHFHASWPICVQESMRRFEKYFSPRLDLDPDSKYLAELIFIGTDVQSVSSLRELHTEVESHREITPKVMPADRARLVLSVGRSLVAIQEQHGLLVIYGPIPLNARSYDITAILAIGGRQAPQPASGSGLGYGVLFDARHSRAVVQFGDMMRVLLESDIFDHYSIFKIGIPNAPMEARDSFWAQSRIATP
jgi:hypothetical protein